MRYMHDWANPPCYPRGLPVQAPRRDAWVMQTLIRDSRDDDVPAITAIYAHAVRHGDASFELEPPGAHDMMHRRQAVRSAGYPYIVAEYDGAVVGYAYASAYRPRPAYRFTVENSVYVAPEQQRRRVGHALLQALIARCEAAGFRLMVAVIGDSANHASIGLHAAHGFTHAGLLPAIGWKHGRWIDSVLMCRPLGDGADTPPP